ncbi:MBL fold metallo-hydrolase [Nonomuraea sp. NPDC050556]|uniref:MBL fold metallo-hydrolase n=1 Tax=Nonomuraea sp. NPDC050556 TaxID=3364369 RepID=UPI0037AE2F3A
MPIDFVTGAPVDGDLRVRWIHGADGEPPIQVHAYDAHTFVLRQSKTVHFEGPFLFLMFGQSRALLLDSGASDAYPLRECVDRLVDEWLAVHPREGYELVVAHTHAHGDHIAGDAQFAGRAATTVVGVDAAAVQDFYGFTAWPDQVVTFDLGGRVLEIIGSPGHHDSAITVYDGWTGLLFTGDTVYPGRLYARDYPAFVATLERMVAFAEARPVTHVLGCHIEMTRRPGRDYPMGATYQPDEPPLELSLDRLRAVRDAAATLVERRGIHAFDDFIIYNSPGRLAMLWQAARAWWFRLRH